MDWRQVSTFRMIRVILLWVFALFLLLSGLGGLLGQGQSPTQNNDLNAIQIEHRFTTLETKVETIASDLKEVRQYNWISLLGMAGLLGEAGLRIVKKPTKGE